MDKEGLVIICNLDLVFFVIIVDVGSGGAIFELERACWILTEVHLIDPIVPLVVICDHCLSFQSLLHTLISILLSSTSQLIQIAQCRVLTKQFR